MAVLLLAILIGGIGEFAINSFLYDKSTIVKTERKEKNEQFEEEQKDEEENECIKTIDCVEIRTDF